MHYPGQRTQRFWVLPKTQNSHTAHTSTTYQYTPTLVLIARTPIAQAPSIWSPLASSTSINKLQVMQNAALRTATACTQYTNIQHLHDETLTHPIHEHLQLHASQYKQKTQHPSHPLHKHTAYFNTPR